MKPTKKSDYIRIELPATWKQEIREERVGSDGRVFLGVEGYTGFYALWVVEPEIKLEAKHHEDYQLYFIAKVKGAEKGVKKIKSHGRATIGKKHAHKKVLVVIFKKELDENEVSILEDIAKDKPPITTG
ncbi:MAG: hypothetical protein R6U17_09515 [Thermoplasmata archaeon]